MFASPTRFTGRAPAFDSAPGVSLLDQLFGDLLAPLGNASLFADDPFVAALGSRTRFSPATNVVESATDYTITFDVPGVTVDDLSVTCDRGLLSVSGTIELPVMPGGGTARYVERATGSFARAFRLPETIDEAQIAAELIDGVLTVRVPKNPDARTAIQVPIHTTVRSLGAPDVKGGAMATAAGGASRGVSGQAAINATGGAATAATTGSAGTSPVTPAGAVAAAAPIPRTG